ncbi:hypothetical protein [Nocardioides nitrophenolicus]|uniref:hypothetical protein n=1 Tax=Nocardioides nitrophenolicus TaxID=60489 RepID=UPI00195A6B6F|nr:hypothetical protein [Nocardioides nitrophenolicus]MBM7516263.1 hypothetical protein [Nocardioides nitrophenolicus]
MTPIEDLLGAELHRLTDRLAPSTDPDGDLRRGRRRRQRVRLAVGCGSVVALASASAAVALASAPAGNDATTVAQDPTPVVPTTSPTPTPPPAAPTESRCVPADGGLGAGGDFRPVAPDLLRDYRAILAERLDPSGRHLGPAGSGNQVGTSADPACPDGQDRLTSYGTRLDWRVPGERGLGMIQVEVNGGPADDGQVRLGHDDWLPRPVDLPGVASAEVATYDGGVAVVVRRTDGMSVGIDANTLFGNNSRTPVSGIDLTVDELVVAAADPRFSLS